MQRNNTTLTLIRTSSTGNASPRSQANSESNTNLSPRSDDTDLFLVAHGQIPEVTVSVQDLGFMSPEKAAAVHNFLVQQQETRQAG
jgi:hypothetical protein